SIRSFMAEIVRIADETGRCATEISKLMPTHFREFMGDKFWRSHIASKSFDHHLTSRYYWRAKQLQDLPEFDPNRIRFKNFEYNRFRDIGRNEPAEPNFIPFLDGKPIPTLEELYRMGA